MTRESFVKFVNFVILNFPKVTARGGMEKEEGKEEERGGEEERKEEEGRGLQKLTPDTNM